MVWRPDSKAGLQLINSSYIKIIYGYDEICFVVFALPALDAAV
jgi:hypothetical protein